MENHGGLGNEQQSRSEIGWRDLFETLGPPKEQEVLGVSYDVAIGIIKDCDDSLKRSTLGSVEALHTWRLLVLANIATLHSFYPDRFKELFGIHKQPTPEQSLARKLMLNTTPYLTTAKNSTSINTSSELLIAIRDQQIVSQKIATSKAEKLAVPEVRWSEDESS